MTAIDNTAATLKVNGGNVVVRARGPNGKAWTSYQAPYVLVTVPLGVLKKGSIAMPQLPTTKQVGGV